MLTISSLDCAILAYFQLLQPATVEEAFAATKGKLLSQTIEFDSYKRHFNSLERNSFFWRTADKRYIVTPKAYPLIDKALPKKQRDKLRLLLLNKKAYDLDRVHRHSAAV
jgi:hypothetical protein